MVADGRCYDQKDAGKDRPQNPQLPHEFEPFPVRDMADGQCGHDLAAGGRDDISECVSILESQHSGLSGYPQNV